MNEGPKKLVDTYMKAQLIDYVITFLEFLDPPPPHMHVLVLILSKNWHFPRYKFITRNISIAPKTC